LIVDIVFLHIILSTKIHIEIFIDFFA